MYAKSSGQQTPGEYNQLFEELILGELLEEEGRAPENWQVVMVEGRRHAPIEDVSRFYQLPKPIKNGRFFEIIGKGQKIKGEVGKNEIFMNNVKYFLCFPLREREGTILISAMDITKIIEPVMRPSQIKNASAIKTVILDAGFGEHYNETKVDWSPEEKDAIIDIILSAKHQLEQKGYTVHLTRSRDEFIPLEDRVAFANKFTNAVFISVHFNKSSGGGAGIQTFTLAPRGVPSLDESFSDSDLQLHPGHARDPENIALATALHSSMLRQMRLYDRGINRARFTVIRDIKIPGALLEVGCINHLDDGSLLATSEYRNAFSGAIFNGVELYSNALSNQPK